MLDLPQRQDLIDIQASFESMRIAASGLSALAGLHGRRSVASCAEIRFRRGNDR
jgi:hypothetical protein